MGLIEDLGDGPIALDTSVFIYFIEEDRRFLAQIAALFALADAGERVLVTSSLTLLEVLVVPYRMANQELAERYERLLTGSRGVRLMDLARRHVRAAARIRAATGIKVPDALQLAVALDAGCKSFVTNDRRLPNLPSLRVVQLSSYA